jgi:hypothetical protein
MALGTLYDPYNSEGLLMSFDTVARRLSARIGGPLGFLIALSIAVRRVKRWRAQRSAPTRT